MHRLHKLIACWTATFLFLLSAGCTYIAPGEPEELAPIKTIGVLPAHTVSILQSEEGTSVGLEEGVEVINLLLADYFRDYKHVDLISQSELDGIASAEPGRPFYLAREAGKQLNYDGILVTSVNRYQEREGTEFAVINPASVAFSFRLLDVDSGMIVWSADFDQTQKPLFENILPKTRATGSGFRWLTAHELAAAGLIKKLNNSPYLNRD